jgi:hypothetical protein
MVGVTIGTHNCVTAALKDGSRCQDLAGRYIENTISYPQSFPFFLSRKISKRRLFSAASIA